MKKDKTYIKPNPIYYSLTRFASNILSKIYFKRKIIRNELKGVKGPALIIANHECALDFVNLIGAFKDRVTFVISKSFYESLSINPILKKIGVIPKQQFQTNISTLKKMKYAADSGQKVVLFPQGIMTENGLSTPIPPSTYKFFRFMNQDVYVARSIGTYFVMPKWSKGFHKGETYVDIYKLFTKEETKTLSLDEIKSRVDEALLFDCYKEQKKYMIKYKNVDKLEGLEGVLYMCPTCGSEFTIKTEKNKIYCENCGYTEYADEYGFFKDSSNGPLIDSVPLWSKIIYERYKEMVKNDMDNSIKDDCKIMTIDDKKHKFTETGEGRIEISKDYITLKGTHNGIPLDVKVSTANIMTLPFGPSKYIEVQDEEMIYRCMLSNGLNAQKMINTLKIFYELKTGLNISYYDKYRI
ncbi:1-acyl-sn-glycerol-3-phosphate acyltransferase [bacterium]|nr:1-acyl-sn-glycerol-3-phosphate acyltransferase [bacterium]